MTKINRIVLQGFKSFAHKTEIPFQSKFNVILGPNGSGKSNLGDALCFVLGRLSAKSMRAEKAANLIFNGAKNRKPADKAMVEITFDNSSKIFPLDAAEVVISRTLNKDGNSIYRANGRKMTRSEILDLLAAAKVNPDGYNIILQGDITRFVDMPSLQRRQILEEISDVAAYEEKKHKAVLELQKVEEKLSNAEIILKERGVHLKELKKDRDQALKFRELKGRIDSSRATALHLQIQGREQQQAAQEKDLAGFREKIQKAEEKISAHKGAVTGHKESAAAINRQIEQQGEKEQLNVHRQVEELKVTLAKDKTRVSAIKDELGKIQQRRDQLRLEIQDVEEKSSSARKEQQELQKHLQQKQRELRSLEESITAFRKKHNLESSQELEQQLEELEHVIEQKQEGVQKLRQEQQELLREKDRLELQVQNLDERLKKVQEVEKQHREQLKALQQKKEHFRSLTLRLNQCLEQDSGFAAQLGTVRKRLQELQEKQNALNARTASLQAGLASNQALAALRRKKVKGLHGTVAELGQVQKKYALALETAAGNRMQHLVVDTDKTAAECIAFLKEQKAGTASFIPLNQIKARGIGGDANSLLKQKGAHDFALNLVSFKLPFRKAFEYVFGDTLIVEDIEAARSIGIGRIKMASLDGNLAELSGVMKGGFVQRRPSLGFREQDALQELGQVEKESAQQEGVQANILQQREANEAEITALRKQRAELEAEVITLEKSLHLEDADLQAGKISNTELQAALKKADGSLQGVVRQINSINRELAELKGRKQLLRSKASEARDPRIAAQLAAFEESRQQCREEIVRAESELKNAGSRLQSLFAPEREKMREILKQQDREEQRFTEELKKLNEAVALNEKELIRREKESRDFYSRYKDAFAQREKINSAINKAENEIESIRESIRNLEREVNLRSLKNAEANARLAALQEEFKRYKEAPLLKDKGLEELQQEIQKFERLLAEMSAVNLKALEVYEQVETEFNRLLGKKAELEKEKTDVLTLMNEIETKKTAHFMKTFNQANENFQRIFGSLFKKGKAYLQLDSPKNPFEEGVSVKVKITGSRFLDIKSLSGGEKTLTALAFIFAIQEYQPSSFYVLDEVDAALDKQNSEVLSQLIRNYADQAQYLLISHNDALISEADTLFGVSMAEGVSKVTSLRI